MRDERMLGYSYALTFKSEHRVPVAAILSRGSRVIKQGFNVARSHPLQKNQYIKNKHSQTHSNSTHAEIYVIDPNYQYDKKHSLYISRRKKDGSLGLAKPCAVCMEIIKKSGIGKIIYSIGGVIKKPHYGILYI